MRKILLAGLIAFLISGCCDDPVEVARFELNEKELELIPYQEGDKINFIHSNGYEFDFETTNRATVWEEEHPFCEWACCGKEYFSYQVNTTSLKSVYPDFEITLTIIAGDSYVDYYEPNALKIEINRSGTNLYYDSLANFTCENLLNCVDCEELYNCIDTLKLNEKEYYNVIEAELNDFWIDDTTTFRLNSILYNKQKGIIQIKTSNNETYTIN